MNLADMTIRLFTAQWNKWIFRATVTGTSGNLVTIQRPGFSADSQSYARLNSYSSPTNGDEVLVMWIGGGYLVLGKILR